MIKITNKLKIINIQQFFSNNILVEDTVEVNEIITSTEYPKDIQQLAYLLSPINHDALLSFINSLPEDLQGTSSQIVKSMKLCLDS